MYNIKITSSLFKQVPNETIKIIEICQRNGIEITGTVFLRNSSEVEEIINLCKKYNVKFSNIVFSKKAKELEKSIEFVSSYGQEYLTSLIVANNHNHLYEVFPLLEAYGLLPYIINSPSILNCSYDEIQERLQIIIDLNEPVIVNEKFNPIFGMSKKRLQQKIKQNTVSRC